MEYIVGSVLILFSLIIIFVVLLQEGRQANLGAISGAADSFLDKGAAKTLDQKLSKWTKVIAIAFFVLVLAGMLITNYYADQVKNPSSDEGTSTSVNVDGETTNDGEFSADSWNDTATSETEKGKENASSTAHKHTDDCNHG